MNTPTQDNPMPKPSQLVTTADASPLLCETCQHMTRDHDYAGCVFRNCPCETDRLELIRAHIERIVRREIIAELLGAAEELDDLDNKGHDALSPAEIASNLRARVMVIRDGQ